MSRQIATASHDQRLIAFEECALGGGAVARLRPAEWGQRRRNVEIRKTEESESGWRTDGRPRWRRHGDTEMPAWLEYGTIGVELRSAEFYATE